jgi:hypothetical protein
MSTQHLLFSKHTIARCYLLLSKQDLSRSKGCFFLNSISLRTHCFQTPQSVYWYELFLFLGSIALRRMWWCRPCTASPTVGFARSYFERAWVRNGRWAWWTGRQQGSEVMRWATAWACCGCTSMRRRCGLKLSESDFGVFLQL